MKTDAFLNWQTRLTKIEQCLIWEAPAICKGKSKNAVTHVPTDILLETILLDVPRYVQITRMQFLKKDRLKMWKLIDFFFKGTKKNIFPKSGLSRYANILTSTSTGMVTRLALVLVALVTDIVYVSSQPTLQLIFIWNFQFSYIQMHLAPLN